MTQKSPKTNDTGVLVSESGFEGQYVVFFSRLDKRIVAAGNDPEKLIHQAKEAGASHPFLMFVPEHDMTFVY